ncbi:MAG: hypothetical protein RIM23_19040 [Coleofasciculus sp. G3-WIS-01]|uniref:hypothetical protein n=1 Tax=Coleofasciculus sp. G3-WIS-01 TaxID=3069528 RepID=UPI003304DD95
MAIAVLDYGNTSGQELEQPVGFKVRVENGVVDTRYLWSGLIGSGILGIMAIIATPFSGKVAIATALWFPSRLFTFAHILYRIIPKINTLLHK